MQTGVLLGLAAALLWGVADFCARGASRTGGAFRTLVVVEAVAIPAVLLLAGPFGLIALDLNQWPAILGAAAVGLIILAGAGLLYRAFAIGKLALVSPIASGFAAVTALLAIASGEKLAGATLLGVSLTIIGVVLASSSREQPDAKAQTTSAGRRPSQRFIRGTAPGLLEAIGALLTFGLGYWLLDFVVPTLGGVTTAFIAKVADLLALGAIALGYALWRRRVVQSPRAMPTSSSIMPSITSSFWIWAVPTALLDTAANIAYNIGIASALTTIVVTLSSLFSAVTILLASIFLRERLAPWQWAGVCAILVGVATINLTG